MKKQIFLILFATLFTACSSSTSSDDNNMEDISTTSVHTFDSAQNEIGTSTLTRTDNGISYEISASEMTPGDAVTLWVVTFNNPEHCDPAGCGESDLFVEEVQADMVFGGDGHVIGSSGEATFTGSWNVGANSGSVLGEWFGLPENGLLDSKKAEIHFILHTHGPVIEGMEDEMTSTFNAGCGPDFMEGAPPVPESLGTHGPNTCADYAFAVHPQSDEY